LESPFKSGLTRLSYPLALKKRSTFVKALLLLRLPLLLLQRLLHFNSSGSGSSRGSSRGSSSP